MSEPAYMTKGQYAEARGWSPSYVSHLINAGRVVLTDDQRVDVEATDDLIAETSDPSKDGVRLRWARERGEDGLGEHAPGAEDREALLVSFHEARTREMTARAERQELEAAKLAGRLVHREEVEAEAYARARQVKESLLAVPDRLAPLLAHEPDPETVRGMLDQELRRVLGDTVGDVRMPQDDVALEAQG